MSSMSSDNEMSSGDLLAHMGTDAQRWAEEWCKKAVALEMDGRDLIDEDWMTSWFANAIEAGRNAGMSEIIGSAPPIARQAEQNDEAPTHLFVGYDANPNICRFCGAVKPMPCYRIKVD